MPGLDGIEATKRIASDSSLVSVHVIILTTFEHDGHGFKGLRARAAGFLVKDTDAVDLLRAVRVVAAGETLLSPTITRRLIAEFPLRSQAVRDAPDANTLTVRKREVLALIAAGLSNEEIATKLFVSVSTAKTHTNRAMSKLGGRDRAQLVIVAYESGLVRPGWAT